MLVDDHMLFSSGLSMLLEKQADISVVAKAATSSSALKFLKNIEVDMVLMDISLPDTDGLETTRLIRHAYPSIKIIVLTMHDDEPYLLKALEAGAEGYVLKEAATTELVSAIKTVMQGEMAVPPSMVRILVNQALEDDVAEKNSSQKEDMLTDREKEVIHYIGLGYTNKEIADKLFISIKTAEKHRYHIMEKLNLKRRYQLVRYAIKKGLINFNT